jgi:hypothetical protein
MRRRRDPQTAETFENAVLTRRTGVRRARVASAVAAALLAACTTDGAPSAYGETFGPLPERRDAGAVPTPGAPASDAGAGVLPDGGGISDAGSACPAGTLAIVAGSDAVLAAGIQERGGAWKIASLSGASRSLPALVATSSGFVGAVRGASDAVLGLAWGGASWTAPAAIGSAKAIDAPSLAASATPSVVHLALLGPTFEHAYGRSTQGTWSAANEPLQAPQAAKSFGPSGPAIAESAEAGGEAVVAFDGDDGGLYVQTRSAAGVWSSASPVLGAGVTKTVPPVLVPLEGASDLLLLFVDGSQDKVIRHAVRTAAGKTWSAVQNTGPLAFTPESVRAARVSASQVVVGYRGHDGRAYAMIGTITAGAVSWAAPSPLLGATAASSAPAIAPGVCGDEAVAVVPVTGPPEAVRVVRLRNGAWSAPEDVPGLSGARVAAASR